MTAEDVLKVCIEYAEKQKLIWVSELPLHNNRSIGKTRIDFWTLSPFYRADYNAEAYEIKISRSDFKRDSKKKQDRAIHWSNKFWYVTPPELLKKTEIPEWAGLKEVHNNKLKVIKKAPWKTKAEPDWQLIVNIIRNAPKIRRDVIYFKEEIKMLRDYIDRKGMPEENSFVSARPNDPSVGHITL